MIHLYWKILLYRAFQSALDKLPCSAERKKPALSDDDARCVQRETHYFSYFLNSSLLWKEQLS